MYRFELYCQNYSCKQSKTAPIRLPIHVPVNKIIPQIASAVETSQIIPAAIGATADVAALPIQASKPPSPCSTKGRSYQHSNPACPASVLPRHPRWDTQITQTDSWAIKLGPCRHVRAGPACLRCHRRHLASHRVIVTAASTTPNETFCDSCFPCSGKHNNHGDGIHLIVTGATSSIPIRAV